MADLNNLLLMQLAQSYADQGSGKNPFGSPTSGGIPGEMPVSMEEQQAGSNIMADSPTAHARYGISDEDAAKPVEGELAKQFGVEGVVPNYEGLDTVMNMLKISAEKGYAAGQQAGPDPVIRSALAYQALQQQAQALGGNSPGGMLINAMGPLMAPRMLGPMMERARAEEQNANQQAMAMKLAQTAQLGEKRRADIELAQARKKKLDAETMQVGKSKLQLRGSPASGGWIFDPATGDIIKRIEPDPNNGANTGKPPKPVTVIDPKTGFTVQQHFASYQDLYDKNPSAEFVIKAPGSQEERKRMAQAYGLLKTTLDEIPTLYKKGMTGPWIGDALQKRKTGEGGISGFFGVGRQYGAMMSRGMLSDEDLKKALDLRSKIAIANQQLTILATGLSYTDKQMDTIRQSMAEITDYDEDFQSALKETAANMQKIYDDGSKLMGIDLSTGSLLDPTQRKPGVEGAGVGAPMTKPKSELQRRRDDEILNSVGLD